MAKKEHKKINLRGYCLWARILETVPAGGRQPEEDTKCTMLMECGVETYKKLLKAGYRAKLRKAEECFGKEEDGLTFKPIPEDLVGKLAGKTFVPLKRDVLRTARNGKQYNFNLPKVVDRARQPIKDAVGNGSEVIARCEIIPFAAGKDYKAGIKLNLLAVQVLDHVVYEAPEKSDEDDFEGFENEPVASSADDNFDADDLDDIDPAFG